MPDRPPATTQTSAEDAPPTSDAESGSVAAPLPTGRPGKPAGPVPDPDAVDRSDASAVAVAAAVWMGSSDTVIDTSWYDASLRAAPFLTPQLLATFAAARPRSGPGREWLEWWEHRAFTTAEAEVSPDDQELADTLLTVYRKVTVRLTPVGRDGWRGEPVTYFQFITLSRASIRAGWQVEAVVDDA
ncbi:hypothetical protein LO772_32125 [Yinghuangia sp. ASG 101]|uniref:hypothetical protein n=1 Tax=Yinghuangia sp. ASG 101 TaxID=2896848 RepID=UPI001E442584|nr:hypothetical protein [Yinghuangia sp. ASG 101]UGQ11390.1 hypothetical protein LO772_32125 [Yinghuangia sp. ASG 101]